MDHLGFEELEVYKHIRELCKGTYLLIKKFPSEEKFGSSGVSSDNHNTIFFFLSKKSNRRAAWFIQELVN